MNIFLKIAAICSGVWFISKMIKKKTAPKENAIFELQNIKSPDIHEQENRNRAFLLSRLLSNDVPEADYYKIANICILIKNFDAVNKYFLEYSKITLLEALNNRLPSEWSELCIAYAKAPKAILTRQNYIYILSALQDNITTEKAINYDAYTIGGVICQENIMVQYPPFNARFVDERNSYKLLLAYADNDNKIFGAIPTGEVLTI